jgi:exonuclease SbcD
MRILHTADWHLGDRLGRIDRTADLQRAVERIGDLCLEHRVDVLLVAGDLFSELSRPDSLRASIEHLARVFLPFLVGGGTVLALTGNHDNETFCQTLRHMMSLAAPAGIRAGELLAPGRLYLAAEPTCLRLPARDGRPVQFALMPYPTPNRYLDDQSRRYQGLEEKNQALQTAFAARLRQLREPPGFEPGLPSVLAAHVHVQGAVLSNLFRLSERESIIFASDGLRDGWAYVALGHIHQPQCLMRLPHVRYSGSIARLDLGEWRDQKGLVLVEVGSEGRRGEPLWLPLDARPIYEVFITNPREDIPRLRDRYPDAAEALVRLNITYEAGKDILNDVLAQLDDIFPNWYDRTWTEAGAVPQPAGDQPARPAAQGFRETVLGYLERQLLEGRDRDEVLRLAEALLEEQEPSH